MIVKKICGNETCKAVFLPRHGLQKYCSYSCKRKTNNSTAFKAHYTSKKEQLSARKDKPCMDCGGSFPPECMDFDHRKFTIKKNNVAQLVLASKEIIDLEIAKCDLVCANCHRIRTRKRRNGGQHDA